MSSVAKKIVFSFFTVFLVFLCAEGMLFIVGFEAKFEPFILFEGNPERELAEKGENYDGKREVVYVVDDVLFWKFKPSSEVDINPANMTSEFYKLYTINSHGFRGADFKSKKNSDTYRIFLLGDSVTFGLYVPEEKTYYKLLEKMLHEAFPLVKFEVISAGIPGYTSFQGLQLLKTEILSYSPDMLIICFGGNNEFAKASYTDREYSQVINRSLLEKASRKVRVLGLLKSLSLMLRNPDAEQKLDTDESSSQSTFRVPPTHFLEDFLEMKGLAEQAGVETIFVVPPHSETNLRWQPIAKDYADIVRFLSKHISVADVNHQFRKIGSDSLFTKDYFHPNEDGHKVFAEVIYPVAREKIKHSSLGIISEALLALYVDEPARSMQETNHNNIRIINGYLGKSAYFNGRDSYIMTPLEFSNLSGLSIVFWIKPDKKQIGDIVTVFDTGHDERQNCVLQSHDVVSHVYVFRAFGVDSDMFRLPPGIWTHVLVCLDLKRGFFSVYLNGERQSHSLLAQIHSFTAAPLSFGRLSETNERHFRGAIDEIVIWGKALSEADIEKLLSKIKQRKTKKK